MSQATVTGSITANNKIYDGTTAATIATRALSGALAGDDVSLSGGTASFASKIGRHGQDRHRHRPDAQRRRRRQLSTGFDQRHAPLADITAALADWSAPPASNKAYDGTTSGDRHPRPDNRVAGDSLTHQLHQRQLSPTRTSAPPSRVSCQRHLDQRRRCRQLLGQYHRQHHRQYHRPLA